MYCDETNRRKASNISFAMMGQCAVRWAAFTGTLAALLVGPAISSALTAQDDTKPTSDDSNTAEAEKQDVVEATPAVRSPTELDKRYYPTPIPDRVMLTWGADPTSHQAVSWRTSLTAGDPVGQIAVADAGPVSKASPITVEGSTTVLETGSIYAKYHRVSFDDLEPETRYMYRVGDGKHFSEWNHFTTASSEPKPFSFIYFGDAQNNIRSEWSRVIREAYSEAPRARFVIHAGDLINDAKNDRQWGEWFESAGWIFRRTPSIATPGNHEYYSFKEGENSMRALTPYWNQLFTFPDNGPDQEDASELRNNVYYIDYQGVRIISLNSNLEFDTQAEWLDQTLENCDQNWTVVTMHHPIYSSKPDRDNAKLRDALQPIFDKHRVDIVLQGHDHTYARSRLMQYGDNEPTGKTARSGKGTLYVVSVSGTKMYELGYREFMDRAAHQTQLFQIIKVDGDTLTYEARTAAGDLYDAFDLIKREGESNELVNRIPDTPERRPTIEAATESPDED